MTRAAPLPADERRATIMAATEPLLVTHGREVTTRQIAEATGVAEGTLFRVFPSKEALIDAVIEDALDPTGTCAEIGRVDPELALDERLVTVVEILQRRLSTVTALFHTIGRDNPHPAVTHDLHRRRQLHNTQLTEAIAAVFHDDLDRLRIPVDDAASLLRSVTFSCSHPLISDGRFDDPARIVDLLLHGIARHDIATFPHDPKDPPPC